MIMRKIGKENSWKKWIMIRQKVDRYFKKRVKRVKKEVEEANKREENPKYIHCKECKKANLENFYRYVW